MRLQKSCYPEFVLDLYYLISVNSLKYFFLKKTWNLPESSLPNGKVGILTEAGTVLSAHCGVLGTILSPLCQFVNLYQDHTVLIAEALLNILKSSKTRSLY